MRQLETGDAVVEFAEHGDGEAILFVHAGVFSDWFAPAAASPELEGFRVIRIRRAGYVAGSAPRGHVTLADHAAHCAALLDELGIESAHVCGHSSGALIALQLGLDRPELVQTLVLIEPAPMASLVGPQCRAAVPGVVGPVMAAIASDDVPGAFDLFLSAVGGDHYREVLDRALGPAGHELALEQSAFFFRDEMRAAMEWAFGPPEAARLVQPMLAVEGSETAKASKIPPESVRLLAEQVPHAETTALTGATHMMPLEDPNGVARLVATFARRFARA
jgi:pimeloyl-ACP methyl ester carboxylesterase